MSQSQRDKKLAEESRNNQYINHSRPAKRALQELLQRPEHAWWWAPGSGCCTGCVRTGVTQALVLCPCYPVAGTLQVQGSSGPHTQVKPYPPCLAVRSVTLCAAPSQQCSSLLPPILNGEEESLAASVFPKLCAGVGVGDAGPHRDATAVCFPGMASSSGFLVGFFTKLFHISLVSQLTDHRTCTPAEEAYVHTLDIAAARLGFSRMKSSGKTPSWLRLLWLGLQIEQHLQRRCLQGFQAQKNAAGSWQRSRCPSSHIRRHSVVVQPASALSLNYPFLKPGVFSNQNDSLIL